MEIPIIDVPRTATSYDVTRAVAKVLHDPRFTKTCRLQPARPVNFQITLTPDTVPNSIRNGGSGTLTIPYTETGWNFLNYIRTRRLPIRVQEKSLHFKNPGTPAKLPPKRLLEILDKVPYQDPDIVEAKEKIEKGLVTQLPVSTLQIGVIITTSSGIVFSPEWEEQYLEQGDARLAFEHNHKLLRLNIGDHSDSLARCLVLKFASLKRIYTGWEYGNPFILFYLISPPALEEEDMYRPEPAKGKRRGTKFGEYGKDNGNGEVLKVSEGGPRPSLGKFRHRLGLLDAAHARVAPYAHQIRIVLKDSEGNDLQEFEDMCRTAQLPLSLSQSSVDVQRLNIFSSSNLRKIDGWLAKLEWPVAFQCEALLRNLRLNALELLALQSQIDLQAKRGSQFASRLLRHYHTVLRSLRGEEDNISAFSRALKEYVQLNETNKALSRSGYFDVHHVSFTPTAVRLEGPYSHQSNRVIRRYIEYRDHFIRVDFRDEDRLQYRWDREVDGASFVRDRVGHLLRDGFTIAGRKFEFLGYSQSQLRAHSVFAVSPFHHPSEGLVTAATIREKVGIFDEILHYPALYAARISQAFSATEDSITLSRDEWGEMDDIKHHNRCFTDGVGTISPHVASRIWEKLCEQRHRTISGSHIPVAFQIRFGGYKGMVVVDPRLTGTMMRLRPSMRKFYVHDDGNMPIEVARAFEYPGRPYLNRPLIQILEDLGVPRDAFMELQAAAVTDVQTARDSLSTFATLLNLNSLGRAFSLRYILQSLDSVGCELEHHDPTRAVGTPFIRGLLDTAILSVLRDMKHSARIPVPQSWNLVGVADEGAILGPGQIYACVWEYGAEEPTWLEGPVMVSRSPTIHPGDVQMVEAVGKPLPHSLYAENPLPNVVVFPCEGKRDLASCLGGGDLDGDLYLLCQYPKLLFPPENSHRPGDYPVTKRKDIGRPSTIQDVAEFVVEYINSDMVGLLSTNHLILSDQSSYGTRDKACLKLAELCSKAVDYPKSGIPVDMKDTPRFLIPYKPDWTKDEDTNPRDTDYYLSNRAIGHLFRAISLEDNTKELTFDPKLATLKDKPKAICPEPPPADPISATLRPIIEVHLLHLPGDDIADTIPPLFRRYCLELKYICVTHTLTYDPDNRLREEEVVVGTILAKCKQARWRKDRIEQMRINTDQLVRQVSGELGSEASSPTKKLAMAWEAWKYAQAKAPEFGHQSFGLIALGAIFKALDELKESPGMSKSY